MRSKQLLTNFEIHLLASGLSPNTVRLRLIYLRQFLLVHEDLLETDRGDLEEFLAARRLTMKAETRSNIRTAFRAFYAWAAEEGYLLADPAARLAKIRVNPPIPRVALDADVQRGLDGASPRHRAMILLARFGCLRREEIATLHTRDRDRNTLRVLGKGEKLRRVPINSMLMDALLEIERSCAGNFYFPDSRSLEQHISGAGVARAIQRHTGWNPHSLRHAGATAAYRSTRDLRAVQELLGHASIATTQRYLHVDEQALRAVADATSIGFEGVA